MTGVARDMDARFMRMAIALGQRGLGLTSPNPSVGCVLVKNGVVVGRGFTQKGGRPHAETVALSMAGDLALGATVYVTLEPCAHQGATGPCADALIKAGVARIVIGNRDPDARVCGRGVARFEAASMAVREGVLAEECAALHVGFFRRVSAARPYVTLKIAASLDGRIATHSGESKWITGERARARAHLLRATHDAVIIGAGTALADDPALTCRLPGLIEQSPIRIVADSFLRLPLTSQLARTAKQVPVWVLHRAEVDATRRAALQGLGIECLPVGSVAEGRLDLRAALAHLADRGITRLLCESGGKLASSLLRVDGIDRIAWFSGPVALGDEAVPGIGPLQLSRLADAPRFERRASEDLGPDRLDVFERVY